MASRRRMTANVSAERGRGARHPPPVAFALDLRRRSALTGMLLTFPALAALAATILYPIA